jgi:hypothetical protein
MPGGVPILGQQPEQAIGLQLIMAMPDSGLGSGLFQVPRRFVTAPNLLPPELAQQFGNAITQGFWQTFSALAQAYNQSAQKGAPDAEISPGLIQP